MGKTDDKMQDFFKGICKDMKEETERVQKLVKAGIIKTLPNKEGIIYDAPSSNNKGQNNKKG